MRLGTVSNGQLWLRCPHCGDSQRHPDKGHLAVNTRKGVYYCVRCGASGLLSLGQQLDLQRLSGDNVYGATSHYQSPRVRALAGSRRFSALQRFHSSDAGGLWDVFEMRDPQRGDHVGFYYRRPLDKISVVSGDMGLGYCGDTFYSSPDDPIRIVEGPYDVLTDRDACVFGFIRRSVLRTLQGHTVILTPDGDVWSDPLLTARFVRVLQYLLTESSAPYLAGLEILPDNLDPDEVPVVHRRYISRERIIRRLYEKEDSRGIRRTRRGWQIKSHFSGFREVR